MTTSRSEETEHPKPTPATIRGLYANAFSCAHPRCSEWLYRHETGSARPILNSRVAHIHARSPRGPRWLPGMSSDDNRRAENLLLLCIPHSYGVDEDETRFPPEMLQEWRLAQLQEHLELLQSWSITDDQAHEVARESFDSPVVAGQVLAAVVRAAELLGLRALASRSGPAEAAAAWRTTRARTRGSFYAHDDEGNRVYAEPSTAERQRHEAEVAKALNAVREALVPLADVVLAEAATARHSVPRTGSWCDWLEWATEEIVAAASAWPWQPPYEDDDRLLNATEGVREAAGAVAAVLRGEKPAQPPSAPVDDGPSPETTAIREALARHEDLLDLARPWRRVKTKPFDPMLRAQLVDATDGAAVLPPVMATASVGLDAAAGLAAAVARNATDDEVKALIQADRARRPLVVAATLLAEMWREMGDAERDDLANLARDAFLDEVSAHDWTTEAGWEGNRVGGHHVFNPWWHWTSANVPKAALAAALDAHPERLDDVVLGCAPWVQRESTVDGRVSAARSYRELSPWFPTQAVVRAATIQYPHVAATSSTYDSGADDGTPPVEHLLGHILRLAD